MAEFVLKNKFFEFNGSVTQAVSGTVIGTKCVPTYACIHMDDIYGWGRDWVLKNSIKDTSNMV